MGKVFRGQTLLTIELTVGEDITGATAQLIKYKKPDGTLGSFTATIDDDVSGVIQYVVTSASDIDQSGQWMFWAHITLPAGIIAGEPALVVIYEEGAA